MHNIKQLFSKRDIAERVEVLAHHIHSQYKDKDLVVIGIMKGSFVFVSDLIRKINLDFKVNFITAKSYEGTSSTGKVKLMSDIHSLNIENKDVLLVDDIVDTGLTMSYIKKEMEHLNPNSIKVCGLINKTKNRKTDINVDYYCFPMYNEFVVGYGLDYNGLYRNLPCIYTYKEY